VRWVEAALAVRGVRVDRRIAVGPTHMAIAFTLREES
jgi:hypothetical protein